MSKENISANNAPSSWQTGTAYIVETREHVNLPLVLNNIHRCLPENWHVIIFCSDKNQNYVTQQLKNLGARKTSSVKLTSPVNTVEDYNNLLFSMSFWQQFKTENLLGFQVDSLINESQKSKLQELIAYDYVGAPWSDEVQRRWSYIPSYGGNGGICFSKRSARIQALTKSDEPRVSTPPDNQVLNEDIWFSKAFHSLGLCLPSRETATKLFVETVYASAPYALHKPWSYLSAKDYDDLKSKIPLLEKVRLGCQGVVKYQQLKNQQTNDYRRFLLAFARESLREKNYYQADLALQVSQSRFPKDPISYNLQSMLAYQLGLYKHARRFTDKALELAPSFEKALENKVAIEKAMGRNQEHRITGQRFLLIHSWGSGLGFDLLFLLKQLMLAELTNRTPVIYWGANSLYNANPEGNCFTDYFEPVSLTTIDDITSLGKTAYPKFWQNRSIYDYERCTKLRDRTSKKVQLINGLYYLNRNESLVISGEFTSVKMLIPWVESESRFYGMNEFEIYADLIAKYIKPKACLTNRAQAFISESLKEQTFIAIHLRGTDKSKEKQSNDIANINQQLIEQLSLLDKALPIFVMSDDVRQVEQMQKRFGKRVFSVDVTRSQDNNLGVHHTASDKQKIAEEVLVDVLIAAQSKYFFGCGFSYLACCVAYMRGIKATSTLLPFDVMTRFNNIPKQNN